MSRNINAAPSLCSRLAVAVALWLLFAISSAFAQDAASKQAAAQAGSIRGAVSTLQDNVLSLVAGISVKLSGEPLHATSLSADTDEHGSYRLQYLQPRAYS